MLLERGVDRERRDQYHTSDLFTGSVMWGIGLALDERGKTSRQWDRWRVARDGQKQQPSRGLTGRALEAAVMALAAADSSLVKIEAAGA